MGAKTERPDQSLVSRPDSEPNSISHPLFNVVTMPETRLQPSETRSFIAPDENKSERFRILIIGNDNAVNSTIFQKVCNSGGLKDRMGNLVCSTILDHEPYSTLVPQISASLLVIYDKYFWL